MSKRIVTQQFDKSVNVELLSEELHEALGETFVHVRINNGQTRIALLSPSSKDLDRVKKMVDDHKQDAHTKGQKVLSDIYVAVDKLVGKPVTDLTTPEKWDLFIALLYQSKAISPDMTIRSSQRWIAPQDTDDD